MRTVALTGAAGYLGRKLLALLEQHHDVARIVCTDARELPRDGLSDKTEFHRMDIRDRQLAELFTGSGVDTVIHLAFIVDPIRNLAEMHSINRAGTANVLAAAAGCGARQVIAASSTSAFGAFPGNPSWLDESAPPREHAGYAYAADKYAVEVLIKKFMEQHDRVKVAVVRPCIVYGPGVDNYLSRFVLGWPFLIQVGSDRPLMQFVHEDDVAAAFMLIFEQEAAGYFHVVGEGLISTAKIAELAGIKVLSLPSWLAYPLVNLLYRLHFPGVEAPAAMLDFIRYRWTASDGQTRARLNFRPRFTSKEVIAALVARKRRRQHQKGENGAVPSPPFRG